mgnify:CR=1 FL=1
MKMNKSIAILVIFLLVGITESKAQIGGFLKDKAQKAVVKGLKRGEEENKTEQVKEEQKEEQKQETNKQFGLNRFRGALGCTSHHREKKQP